MIYDVKVEIGEIVGRRSIFILVAIFIGGCFGTALRVLFQDILNLHAGNMNWYIGTFLANMLACALFGGIATMLATSVEVLMKNSHFNVSSHKVGEVQVHHRLATFPLFSRVLGLHTSALSDDLSSNNSNEQTESADSIVQSSQSEESDTARSMKNNMNNVVTYNRAKQSLLYIKAFVCTGFCGSLSTMSSFDGQVLNTAISGGAIAGLAYMIFSVLCGLLVAKVVSEQVRDIQFYEIKH